MQEEKTVWVTGASSGLGLHTAMALRDAGWRVVAGARSFQPGMEPPAAAQGGRLADWRGMVLLPLDVTDPRSVSAFRDAALAAAPPPEALVQCAGMLVLGSCEETSPEEFLRVMDTNFLGMVRMNQAVLPLFRSRGRGRIVLFSSINGLLGIPFQNAYTASKHAIEGYAEGLQMEVRPFGIQVALVEPGDHRGGSGRYRPRGKAMSAGSPYAEEYRRTIAKIDFDEHHGSDPDVLGRKVARMLCRRHMPFRRRIASPDQHLAVYVHRFLPARLNERILRSYYLKGKSQ